MSAPKPELSPYEELLALPPTLVGEVIDGVLYTQRRPPSLQSSACTALSGELRPFRDVRGGPGGWLILFEPELHLGARPDVLVPDLAGWRRSRMPELPDAPNFTLAPDWACEVLSPSTRRLDRIKKLQVYRREQISHVWLVDPIERTLEVFRLANDLYSLAAAWNDESEHVRAEPFDAIALHLAALWQR